MSRTAIILVALALATSFGIGRATAPEPATAGVSDATLADVVAQLKLVNKNLGGYANAAFGPSIRDNLEALCQNFRETMTKGYRQPCK